MKKNTINEAERLQKIAGLKSAEISDDEITRAAFEYENTEEADLAPGRDSPIHHFRAGATWYRDMMKKMR